MIEKAIDKIEKNFIDQGYVLARAVDLKDSGSGNCIVVIEELTGIVSTFVGGGFYYILLKCDQPTFALQKTKPMLLKKGLLPGSYVEEKFIVDRYLRRRKFNLLD